MGLLNNKKVNEASDYFVDQLNHEINDIVLTNYCLSFNSYKRYIVNFNDEQKNSFFQKSLNTILYFSKKGLSAKKCKEIITDVNKVIDFYQIRKNDLTKDEIKSINDISDSILFKYLDNKIKKIDVLNIKELLILSNTRDDQIYNALIWICIRFFSFMQCFAVKSLSEQLPSMEDSK